MKNHVFCVNLNVEKYNRERERESGKFVCQGQVQNCAGQVVIAHRAYKTIEQILIGMKSPIRLLIQEIKTNPHGIPALFTFLPRRTPF